MRLTLCALSSQYIHMPLAPFCLRKAVEEKAGFASVTICDLNINDTKEALLRAILATQPDVLGLSVYIWNREQMALLARRVKAARPEVTIVLGGPEVTWSVEDTLRQFPCDYLLRGAGEDSLPALLHALRDGTDHSAVPGLCMRKGDVLHIGDVAPTPAPRADLYDDIWHDMLAGRMIYAETSRGCPFACAFCLSGQREKVQFLPDDEALALLIRLGQAGGDTVKLIDRTFNCNPARTRALIGGLIDAHQRGEIANVCYHMEVAADLFDDETLALLRTAPVGLFQMAAGLQSFNPETLAACRRRTDMAKLERNLRILLGMGNIHLHIDLIAGLPYEDYATFSRSFDKAYTLQPHQLQLGFLKLIHGSHLRDTSWGARFAPDPPYEVLSTPWISYDELCRLQDCAEAVERISNSGRFANTIALALTATGMRPFDLFTRLGEAMASRPGRWSLDALSQMIYDTLLSLGIDADVLRDAMVTDRLATDNTGYLPPFLQRHEQALKPYARAWRMQHPEEKHPRLALSADGQRLLCAVWRSKHPVTQRGDVLEIPLQSLDK